MDSSPVIVCGLYIAQSLVCCVVFCGWLFDHLSLFAWQLRAHCKRIAYILFIFRWNQIVKEKFEDTKGVIRIHKSNKGRQHNGQAKSDKWSNNHPQNTTQQTNDWAMYKPHTITGDESMYKQYVYNVL
jgi:hypothetical protein